MPVPKLLQQLLTAPGPSGYERTPARIWRAAASEFATVVEDTLGSSSARINGQAEGPLMTIVGHIDEIGIIITHIDKDGLLRFTGVGGWDTQVLVGQRIQFITKDGSLIGVVSRKPIHLQTQEEREKVPKYRDLHVDIGAKDADQAAELISVGDVGVIAAEPVELVNQRIASRSLDNRIGCYVALEAIRRISESGGSDGDVIAVAAVQEEITFGGSQTTAFALEPQLSLVIDVTFETDAPGVDSNEMGEHKFGSGPVIGRGSTLHPQIFELLTQTAKLNNIPYTVSASARRTGTDADAIHHSRTGIPTGVVSIPIRYMHSPVEMAQLDDIEHTVQLVAAFAQALDDKASFVR